MRSLVVASIAAGCACALIACAAGDASYQAAGAIHVGGDGYDDHADAIYDPKPDTRGDDRHDTTPASDAAKGPTADTATTSDTHGDDTATAVDAGTDTAIPPAIDSAIVVDTSIDTARDDTAAPDVGIDATDAGFDATPSAATWYSTAEAHRCAVGARFVYECPAGGPLQRAWGTGEYTDDSSICTAAVHAGKLDMIAGGTITIAMHAGASSYVGSTANGVTTSDYGAWSCGFSVE